MNKKGRVEASTASLLIAFIIVLSAAIVMLLYSESLGLPAIPTIEDYGVLGMFFIWGAGGAISIMVLYLVRKLTGD